MPPRLARPSLQASAPRTASKKHRKRHLDAFAIAGKVAPEKLKIRSHRLGVAEDDEPKQKRRRTDDSDDEELSDGDEDGLRSGERNQKRRKQSEDDDVEFGSDSEGNEWVAGGLMDGDDDESIDSDEAFGESDEERFEGFTFRGSSKTSRQNRKPKPREAQPADNNDDFNLDEDQSSVGEEEDDFGDEGVDLATMLDDDPDDDDDEAGSSQEDEDDDNEDLESDLASDPTDAEDDGDSQRHARLQDFVEGLDKRSTANVADDDVAADEVITLDDLLEGADLDSKTLATLKPKRKSKAAQLVKPLLPKRQQDAINREIATEKAKEQLDRWRDTVIQNRRAEFLSFPLKHAGESGPAAKDTFAPVQRDAPTTDLETHIHKIMEESGMLAKSGTKAVDPEDDLLKAEELATKQLPVEEVLRRRAELRRTRELLFREEIKAKRIAKIKSKSYRRVHRKERERLAEKERMLMDPEGYAEGVLNEDEQDLADRQRAEARMNAKHKTSKWAKSLRATNRTVWDTDARDGAIDMARRQEELKRRIAGKNVNEEDADESFSDADDEDDDDLAGQISKLRDADDHATNGLASMKFMRAAEGRRRARNNEALAEIEAENGLTANDGGVDVEEEGLGRAIFGPRPASDQPEKHTKQKRPEFEEGDVSDDGLPDGESQVQELQPPAKTTNENNKRSATRRGPLSAAASRPTDQPSNNKPEETSIWLTAPREKKSKLDRRLARQDDDAIITTDVSKRTPAISSPAKPPSAREETAPNTGGWTLVQHGDASDVEAASDHENDAPILTQAERNAAFHARAFAGDDVALQFDAEKDALVASEDEKEINNSMPGWGSWTGAGLSKSVRKAAQRARHNPLYKSKVDGVRPQDRKDAKLENVIISEKSDRKGKKYLAPMLPHQYERKEEYERSLRMPIGPEWVTKEVFQRNTRPRVVVKPGTIIEPISRPLV